MNEYNKSPGPDAREEPVPANLPPAGDASTPPPPPVQVVMPDGLSASEIQSKKLASGLLGILLGAFGIHKFYLGYQQEGIVMILVTLLGGVVGGFITCGLLFPVVMVMSVIGLVEGILYLTKSDEEFANTYLRNRRPWF